MCTNTNLSDGIGQNEKYGKYVNMYSNKMLENTKRIVRSHNSYTQ